ncbi:MAG: DUF2157 domain-containing protein [Acutalibacteraceae bacterium]
MNKISKNIKKLREGSSLTQEQLASKLFITRQAVSSWENGRTQPDIQMLAKLSEVFGVSMEELIYGKKRNTALENEKASYNGTLLIVFSVLGALLAGTGLILIFVTFWQEMPMFFKGILSFLPLVFGQCLGIFTVMKKRHSPSWCEGAGVVWTAGIAATNTMIYNIFMLNINWYTVLLIIALMTIPVLLLLGSVSPMAVYYACAVVWGAYGVASSDAVASAVAAAVLFALVAGGYVYSYLLLRKNRGSITARASQWVSAMAVVALAVVYAISSGEDACVVPIVGAVFISFFIISQKHGDAALPYRWFGILGTALTLFACSLILYADYKLELSVQSVGCYVLALVVILCSLVYIKFRFGDIFTGLMTALSILSLAVYCALVIVNRYTPESDSHLISDAQLAPYMIALRMIAFAAFILMIVSGGRQMKLFPINVGFISVAVLTFIIIAGSDLGLLGNGLVLLAFGAIMLVINLRISRAKQKAQLQAAETAESEGEDK